MQGSFEDQWVGKTVRVYITKVEKLNWNAKAWDTGYVLMAKKEYKLSVSGRDGAPTPTKFIDVAISDEFKSFEDLTGAMGSVYMYAKKRNEQRSFGVPRADNTPADYEYLELLKMSRTDVLNPEDAMENAAVEGHTHVEVCVGPLNEKNCNDFEDEHEVLIERFDPHAIPPPAYREELR